MIGTGKNPNVAAVIVIGIEPKWTKRIVDEMHQRLIKVLERKKNVFKIIVAECA